MSRGAHLTITTQSVTAIPLPVAALLELKAEKEKAQSDLITSVGFNNDGANIVSGSKL